MKKNSESFKCRFPGCEKLWNRSQDRGRHEFAAHKMRGGQVPNWVKAQQAKKAKKAAAPPIEIEKLPPMNWADIPGVTPVEVALKSEFEPQAHLEQALEKIDLRQEQLLETINVLESLRVELAELTRQKQIFAEALERLVKKG